MALAFSKMHGAGNDFVLIDRRGARDALDPALVRRLADRHRGVGFDQLLTIEDARAPGSAYGYGIWNADGSAARQCGNGVRCVAAWLRRAGALPDADAAFILDGPAGPVACAVAADGRVRVDMGEPRFAPADVPFLAESPTDPQTLELGDRRVALGVVSMGNPHAVLEVPAVAEAPVATLGPAIERHPRFPDRANVGFAAVRAPDAVDLRVWERGVGETLACGSGACAAVAVLRRRGRVGPTVAVTLPGGTLGIEWPGPGHPLWMTGPAEFVFEGTVSP